MNKIRYVFTGGGTLGHTNPAIAVAEEVRKQDSDAEILFLMREGGRENEAAEKRGFKIQTFKSIGMDKNSGNSLMFAFVTINSIIKCLQIVKSFKPDVIFATGGYVSFAPSLAGLFLKIPTFIHESNIVPGLVTKTLAKMGSNLMLNAEETKEYLPRKLKGKIYVVGNPILSDYYKGTRYEARKKMNLKDDEILIISFGGSGGAEKINNVLINVMQRYSQKKEKIKHIHASGKSYFQKIKNEYPNLINYSSGCIIVDYINDMPEKLKGADIVISRSGAMTLSELAASKVSAILIPSPNVTNNHQMVNAKYFAKSNAALIIEDENLTEEKLISVLAELEKSKVKRYTLSSNISALSKPDSAKEIYKTITQCKK